MNTKKFDKKDVKVVAHRGLSGIERENTASAFVAAGNRSYYGIETDVYKAPDGVFVCNHDGNLKRVAGLEISVKDTPYSEVREAVLYDKGPGLVECKDRYDIRVPTLDNYVTICKKYEKVGVLELKGEFTESEIGEIIDIIASYDYLDSITFISFNYENLVYVRNRLPEQPVQFLISEATEENIEKIVSAKMDVDIKYTALTKELIDTFHSKGVQVNCWTVDDVETANALATYGVDYITTNILE